MKCKCGRYIIRCIEKPVEENYDACVIAGDDITVAIILRRQLVRIQRVSGLSSIVLRSTCGTCGITADGEYLEYHDCTLPRICETGFKPHGKQHHDAIAMQWPKTRPSTTSTDPWAAELDNELTLL